MTTPDTRPPAGAVRGALRAMVVTLAVVVLTIVSTIATLTIALRYLGPGELDTLHALFAAQAEPQSDDLPLVAIPRPVPTQLLAASRPIPLPSVALNVAPAKPIPVPVARIVVGEQARDLDPTARQAAPREYRARYLPRFGVAAAMPPFAKTEHLSAAWQAYRRELLAATLNAAERDRLAHELQSERALVSSLQERSAQLEAQASATTNATAPPPALPEITPPHLPTPTQAPPGPPTPSPEVLAVGVAAGLDALHLALTVTAASDLRFVAEHTVVHDALLLLVLEGLVSRVEHTFDDYSRELERSSIMIDAPGVSGLPAAAARVLTDVLGEPDRSPTLEPGEVVRFEGRTRTATLTIESDAHVHVDIRHEGIAPGSMQVYRADDTVPTGGVLMRQEPPSAP